MTSLLQVEKHPEREQPFRHCLLYSKYQNHACPCDNIKLQISSHSKAYQVNSSYAFRLMYPTKIAFSNDCKAGLLLFPLLPLTCHGGVTDGVDGLGMF